MVMGLKGRCFCTLAIKSASSNTTMDSPNLQNIDGTKLPFLVTLNPKQTPQQTLLKWSTGHPIPSVAASKASLELHHIQGKRGIWFCGAYQGELSYY